MAEPGRKYMRVAPDSNEYVQIDFKTEGDFSFDYAALVVEESPMGGCSIVCLKSFGIKVGLVCRLKLGHMAPLLSEVVWKSELDDQVTKYGIKFLE